MGMMKIREVENSMIKFLIDKFGGGAIIALLLYSISISFITKGLYDDKSKLSAQITQTEKQLQAERRLRRIDGEAYKKLQAQKKQSESERSAIANRLGELEEHEKNIIDGVIPDSIKRLLNNE